MKEFIQKRNFQEFRFDLLNLLLDLMGCAQIIEQ